MKFNESDYDNFQHNEFKILVKLTDVSHKKYIDYVINETIDVFNKRFRLELCNDR